MPQIETTGEAQSNVSSTDGVPVTGGRFQVSSVDHTPKNSTAVICGDIRNTNNTVILLQGKYYYYYIIIEYKIFLLFR